MKIGMTTMVSILHRPLFLMETTLRETIMIHDFKSEIIKLEKFAQESYR